MKMFEKQAKKMVENVKSGESSKLIEDNTEIMTKNREPVLNSSLDILKKKGLRCFIFYKYL